MAEDPREKRHECGQGITRRGFLTSMGVGTLAVGATGKLLAAPPVAEQVVPGDETTRVNLRVNGCAHSILVEPRWTLLYVLREQIGLTGTKVGCERGECGACTVLMNDVTRYACMTLVLECEGADIITLEGLMKGEDLGPVQQAFLEHDAFQCGYCTPGQIMAVEGMLRAKPHPTPDEIQRGVSGNLCRCGAYVHVFKAARRAAELKAGEEVRSERRS